MGDSLILLGEGAKAFAQGVDFEGFWRSAVCAALRTTLNFSAMQKKGAVREFDRAARIMGHD